MSFTGYVRTCLKSSAALYGTRSDGRERLPFAIAWARALRVLSPPYAMSTLSRPIHGVDMRKPKRSAVLKAAVAKSTATRAPTPAPPRHDPRLKKIYVYAEGTFVLHNASEVHKIVIKTPAFDVAGWIDLS